MPLIPPKKSPVGTPVTPPPGTQTKSIFDGGGQTGTTDAATSRVSSDLGNATGLSNQILEGNEPQHVVDSHAARNEEWLNMLQARLGGLDSAEMRAAREEGQAGLSNQMAQSLERYGSIAGANGVQGGARAGLMGRALHEQDLGRASLERNLILDNIAAKDRAMQAYGAGLGTVTDRALGVTRENTAMDNAFTGLRISMPFQIMSGIGGYRAEDTANASQDRIEDLLTNSPFLSGGQQSPASGSSAPGSAHGAPMTGGEIDTITKDLDTLSVSIKDIHPGDIGWDAWARDASKRGLEMIRRRVSLQYPGLEESNAAQFQRYVNEQYREWGWNNGLLNKEGRNRDW